MAGLYVSDLDGTLLRNDAGLSDFTRTELNRLIDEGLAFTVASARSVVTIREVLEGLRVRLPVIELNGAFVSDFATGEHLIINAIEEERAPELHEDIRAHGCAPILSCYDGHADRVYYDRPRNDGMAGYIRNRSEARDPRLRQVADLTDAFRDRVVCMTVIDSADVLRDLEATIAEKYDGDVVTHLFEEYYNQGWHWMTIHGREASKERAVRAMARYQGLEDGPLVVFGDQENDLCMFDVADWAVAVENAHPALKARADEVIGSNQSDSVVRFLVGEADSGRTKRDVAATRAAKDPIPGSP